MVGWVGWVGGCMDDGRLDGWVGLFVSLLNV